MNMNLQWLLLMAWRDSRRSRGRLLLFTSSIMLGVAALVAINSFGDNLKRDIDGQARELLGADLSIRSNQDFSDTALVLMDSLGNTYTHETNFSSMVYFPKTQGTRPVKVMALEKGGYPFYGEIISEPQSSARSFLNKQQALVDQTLMLQFGIEVGDSVKVGNTTFEIAGKLLQVPGQNSIFGAIYAPVYIPMQYLNETELVKKGSRVNYVRYYKIDDARDVDAMMEGLEGRMRELRLRYDTVEEEKEDLGRSFNNMTEFLNLVAFVALLLGCIGVASSVHIYIKDKIKTVAILRCLGVQGRQTFLIYLLQIAFMGFIGSIAGALLGSSIQFGLPLIMQEFLPFEANVSLSWTAILQGIITGMGIAILFALLPLLAVRKVSPLFTLRSSYEKKSGQRPDSLRWIMAGLIALFIWGFAYTQMGQWDDSIVFTLSIGAGFAVLAGVSWLVMAAIKRYFPKSWSFVWRQSLANLYRPNNQTLVLILSIGLGTALIASLYLVQGMLINQVSLTDQDNRPNMVVFDVQPSEIDDIVALTRSYDFPVIQNVPIVNMRMASLKGKTRLEILRDTSQNSQDWIVNREYRVTFRDSLIDSEKITEGEWIPHVGPSDSVFVSLEEGFGKRRMELELGDELIFDISGVKLKTYVGSFREVDFQRVQTNFLVLFPTGILEQAPQFRVLVTRTSSNETSAAYQRELTLKHPNVSVIDLGLILRTAQQVLDKIAFVIRFMAMFSILTGLLVLIASVINSKYQRIQESVLLRTLGGSRKQILWINSLEYIVLGSLASLTGIILAYAAAWGLATFTFEIDFNPVWLPSLWIWLGITVLTLVIGLINIRSILNKSPLEILRNEV